MRRIRQLTARFVALGLVAAAACGGGGDEPVTIFGPEVGPELESMQAAFDTFTEESGIEVEVQGTRDFEAEIGPLVAGGTPPDIALFPQPGRVREFAGELRPLVDAVVTTAGENFDPGLTDVATIDGDLMAVPVKSDVKSLVWYSPAVFAAAGYDVPRTFDDFLALTDRMMADGNPPFCIGIESGDASGWPMTDWIEDFMLRTAGPDVYDRWYTHQIPFDAPEVVEVAQVVADLWSQDGFIYGGRDAATVTSFADAGLPLLDGECMMHRQANFFAANWPEGTELGPDGHVDAFYLPGSDEHPGILLTGGMYAAAFGDDDDVAGVMAFVASTEFANARAQQGTGFLSPNRNMDVEMYQDELTRHFGEILATAGPVRFDASDLMPGAVGSGAFWRAAIDITSGAEDVATAFAEVEELWPPDSPDG